MDRVPYWYESTLDCQDCGATLRVLSPAEEQQVAERPYDFVVYCKDCGGARLKMLEDGVLLP